MLIYNNKFPRNSNKSNYFVSPNQFNNLISDNKNLKLLNIMSNVCYKNKYRDQKGLSIFMDILFRSCEQ